SGPALGCAKVIRAGHKSPSPNTAVILLLLGYFMDVIHIIKHRVVFIPLYVVTQAHMNGFLKEIHIRELLHDDVLSLSIKLSALVLIANFSGLANELIDLWIIIK